MTQANETVKDTLLDAALMHVAFDGWTEATFAAAIADTGVDPVVAKAVFPRGALDLAVAYHKRGEAAMVERLRSENLSDMRFRDRIAAAVRFRLEACEDKEAVRRGSTLFALPNHAPEGARLIWETCDVIWETLGDTSEDVNWYTKRATLSAVYSSTVLFWLGDDSLGHRATWEFLDRRIDNVMQFEKFKSQVNSHPVLKRLLAGPNWVLGHVRAPVRGSKANLPGSWGGNGG
jgi:ubiquinone biosynthesis protein COQ9